MNPTVVGLDLSFPAGVTSGLLITEYVIKILALGMVPENRQPSSSQAWLLAILFIGIAMDVQGAGSPDTY